ncbi:1,4-alpha-glucan branching protein GlgB [Mangrovitalea sediminis]|uniref:1,4-alpha-glucan branching protein GlgB n=1 Tax=Mangrovitalea sediminis TaxID=1982043 RepID=UPI000BE50FE0|nr:1,4-alpha-glucan branching protein GlgB [Mangrovitalea sediminis]
MDNGFDNRLTEAMERLRSARLHDPFEVLGAHPTTTGTTVRVYIPGAEKISLEGYKERLSMMPLSQDGLFEWQGKAEQLPDHYHVRWTDGYGQEHREQDPYSFPSQIPAFDLHLFAEGRHWHVYRLLGANVRVVDGTEGILFATWAPNAERVSVVGDFNHWDGRRHPLRACGESGVWELFIPGLAVGSLYKFEIRSSASEEVLLKADPYARQSEYRPGTASVISAPVNADGWQDRLWMDRRAAQDWQHQPISIYEVHLGSWQRTDDGSFLNYRDIAHRLVEYVKRLGFTHIELMPITEHPLDDSWGYQSTGYFAPTSRFGTPDDFRYFVDYCHRHDIGVILDWVPAHFPKDRHALAHFDGTPLYEHADPRRGEHRDWGTLIYNYGRNEVRNFLLASANFWLEEFHLDGLRVDAVASMLYLDYSREDGDWLPNVYGGNENLEAIDFLRTLSILTHGQHPGTLLFAEESTAWPQVTRPTWVGGLGFSLKWNMGWMHDTLEYLKEDPVFRHYHHDRLTFGMLYAFTENFVLPFSHDEVVHGKGSLFHQMAGDDWQRFANLRLLYTYQFTYPGAKLLFMGNEFGQRNEWYHARGLDWYLLEQAPHQGVQNLVADLNHLYRQEPALYQYPFTDQGFHWIDCHDAAQSVVTYQRNSDQGFVIVVLNFTPVPRENYRIGVSKPGFYRELFNSDSGHYGGGNIGNGGGRHSEPTPWMGQPHSVSLTLPPLAGLILICEGG